MTCRIVAGVSVCGPPAGIIRRRVRFCPTCHRQRRFVEQWMGACYGAMLTCCGCGDRWMESQRLDRPFRRLWRQEHRAKARRMWQDALTVAEYQHHIARDIAEAVAV